MDSAYDCVTKRSLDMIDLEVPKKFRPLISQARGMAEEVFWPISRKYDRAEHE